MSEAVLAAVLAEVGVCRKALRVHKVPARHVPDLEQDCCIAAWRAVVVGGLVPEPVSLHHGRLDGEVRHRVRGWLWRVAERAACRFHQTPEGRRVGAREMPRAVPELERVTGVAPSCEDLVLERDLPARIEAAIADLERTAPEQHAVLVRYADGYKISEIAVELNILENTAWNRLRLAREFVFAWLAREEASEERQLARRAFLHQLAGAT